MIKDKIRMLLMSGGFIGFLKSVVGYPITLTGINNSGVAQLSVTGKCVQNGVPTPQEHIGVLGVGDEENGRYAMTVNISGDVNKAFKVYTDEPLRAINGYSDVLTLNLRRKRAVVKRCIRQKMLSVISTSSSGSSDGTLARFYGWADERLFDTERSTVQVLSDGLAGLSQSQYTATSTNSTAAIAASTTNAALFFKLPLELIGEATVAAAKEYLSANPIAIYYILATPEETDVSDLQDWSLFSGLAGTEEITISVAAEVVPDTLEAQYYSDEEV